MLTLGRVASRVVQVWSRMQQVLVQKVWVGFACERFSARGERAANSVAWSSNGPSVVGRAAYFSFSFSFFSFSCQTHQQLAFGLNGVGAVKGVAQRLPRWIQS